MRRKYEEYTLTIPEEIYDKAGQEIALPAFYEKACLAVRECETIPEANEWKGAAEAIVAYARVMDDKRLLDYAKRLKARAYRRMGELLDQYDGRPQNAKKQTVADHSLFQKKAAEQAGISAQQQRTAINMARNENFESQLENGETRVTQLANPGIKKNGSIAEKIPEGFTEALYLRGDLKRISDKMKQYDALYILGGMNEQDKKKMTEYIAQIENWFDNFMINL